MNLDYFSIETPFSKKRGDEGSVVYKSLFAAVIDQAVRDYLSYKNPKHKKNKQIVDIGKEAEKWLFWENRDSLRFLYGYENDRDYRLDAFMSFENLCLLLDWSPEWIRSLLKTMIQKKQFYKTGRRRESALTEGIEEDIFL